MDNQEKLPERILVADEVASILTGEHAIEFVKAHYNFIQEIVQNDIKRKIIRSDFEIKDLVAHINALMQNKDEYLFTMIVMHSPKHYQQIQKSLLREINKKEKEE